MPATEGDPLQRPTEGARRKIHSGTLSYGGLGWTALRLCDLLDEATAIVREQNRGRSGPGGQRLNNFLDRIEQYGGQSTEDDPTSGGSHTEQNGGCITTPAGTSSDLVPSADPTTEGDTQP